jgi:hypothetical protein
MEALRKWLEENPIEGESDVEFLKSDVEHHRQASEAARSTISTERETLNWTGQVPYLRLTHCVVDDSIKEAYLNRDTIQPGSMEVENRNSSVREESVWEKIANLWNDREFEPETLCLPDLHPHEFLFPERLTYDKVELMLPTTPSRVMEKIAQMIISLRRCIEKWERSGQGEVGVDPFDDEGDIRPQFGSTLPPDPKSGRQQRTAYALGCRHAFFVEREMYLLYFWELLKKKPNVFRFSSRKKRVSVRVRNPTTQVHCCSKSVQS